MEKYSAADYMELDPYYDLYPECVEDKLEDLVGDVLSKDRVQIDRCLSLCYTDSFLAYSRDRNFRGVFYFTEDPQPMDFHIKAHEIFAYVSVYASILGKIVSSTENKEKKERELLSAGRDVFLYARTGDFPDMQREDLEEFVYAKVWNSIGKN